MKTKLVVIVIITIFFSACVGLKHTQNNDNQTLLPAERPVAVWIQKTNRNAKISIVSNVIFEQSKQIMRAFDVNTEKQLWKYYADNGRNIRRNYVQDNYIVLDYDFEKHVLDNNTGKLKWKTTKEIDPNSLSRIQNGILYYWLKNGALCAVDLNTAKQNWEIERIGLGELQFVSDSTLVITKDYSQAYNERGDEVYIKELAVYDLKKGKEIWMMKLNDPYTENSPEYLVKAIVDNKIFIEKSDTIFAFKAIDGTKLWEKPIPTKSDISTVNNKLLAYNTNSLYCFDFNGNKMWEYEFADKTANDFRFSQNNDNKFVFANTTSAYCIDINGNEQWNFKFDEINNEKKKGYSFIKNNMLYVETDKSYLLNMKGELMWKNDALFSEEMRYRKIQNTRPILLTSNLTIVQPDVNTIKAIDNSTGAIAWTYKKLNKLSLNKATYNGNILISYPGENLLMVCNSSEEAKAKIHKTPQGVEVYDYESEIFSTVKLPVNGNWKIKTISDNEIIVSNANDYNIKAIESGNWKSNLEDTIAAISSIKNSAGYLIRANNYHFRSDGEGNRIEQPVFTTKIVQLENGTKVVMVEAEIKITKPETSRIFGNSYYTCIYYFLAKKEGEKTKFPVIAMSLTLKPENYEMEKKKSLELFNHIANIAILSTGYKILK